MHFHASIDKRDGAAAARWTAILLKFTGLEFIRGDAFYTGYQDGGSATLYGASFGFRVNGAVPGNVPLYNPNHSYTFTFTGTGSVVLFDWDDPEGDYTDNQDTNLVITICGPGMEQG